MVFFFRFSLSFFFFLNKIHYHNHCNIHADGSPVSCSKTDFQLLTPVTSVSSHKLVSDCYNTVIAVI